MKIENYELKGSKLPILTYPDPVLTAVAKPVTEFGEPLKALVQDMLFTMYHAPGIGLAAPQIGQSIRLFVIDVNYDKETITNAQGKAVTHFSDMEPMVFVNPVISPAVAPGRQLLRTSYMATHTNDQLDAVLEIFEKIGKQVGLI